MRTHRCFTISFLGALLGACDADLESGSDRSELINATATDERPEVGLVFGSGSGCTATLVSPRVVLSAAHCFAYATGPTSASFKTGTGQDFQIDYVASYSGTPHGPTDIAVARLTTTVPAHVAVPAPLAPQLPAVGEWLTIFGYGCTDRQTRTGGWVKRKFSFQYPNHTQALCAGDSGGPVFRSNGSIVGVNSGYGAPGPADDIFGIVPYAHAWLTATINAYHSSAGPSPDDGSGLYVGCYQDAETRALPVFAGARGDMTPALCRQMCGGYAYAGAQFHYQCFCGNSIGHERRPDAECDRPCSGDSWLACGGAWRNSLYRTGGRSDAPSFFEHIGFVGATFSTEGDVSFVGWDWNDRISSVRVPPGRTVTLYADENFSGATMTFTRDVVDLRDYGWNDVTSSISVD